MDQNTLHWLAGIMEGEGSFCMAPPSCQFSPSMSVIMTDEDIIKKVADLWGVSYCRPSKQQAHHKQAFRVQVRGIRAVEMMKELRPLMGIRRTAQIDAVIASFSPKGTRDARPDIHQEELCRLRRSGETLRSIAARFGCHHKTIANRLARIELRQQG